MRDSVGSGSEPPAGEREGTTLCLVPARLAAKLAEPLREHFASDPQIEVVVERRVRERRVGGERRTGRGEAPRTERRRIKNTGGRRVGERRAPLVPLAADDAPALPRKARRHAEQIRLVLVVPRSELAQEDDLAARVVIRVQAGDREAFGILYGRYFDRIYAYLRLALADRHAAEDLAQQVFLRALESVDAYRRGASPIRAWLFTIARNVAISHLRKEKRLQLAGNDEIDEIRESEAPRELSVLGWISDADLYTLVGRLPPAQRQVLALRYLFDLGTAEVAQVLGRSPKTVRNLQHSALTLLRQRLTALGHTPRRGSRQRSRQPARFAPVICARRFTLVSSGPRR